MQIAICTPKEDWKHLFRVVQDYCSENYYYTAPDFFVEREALIEAMNVISYSIVIVAVDKAKGFETVKHTHQRNKNSKIIWFSDDKDFAGSAFEYGVIYFALRPITKEKMEEGLRLCGIPLTESSLCRVHLKADENIDTIGVKITPKDNSINN